MYYYYGCYRPEEIHLLFSMHKELYISPFLFTKNYLLCDREQKTKTKWTWVVMICVGLSDTLNIKYPPLCVIKEDFKINKETAIDVYLGRLTKSYISVLLHVIHPCTSPAFLSNQITRMHFNHVNLFNATHSNTHTHTQHYPEIYVFNERNTFGIIYFKVCCDYDDLWFCVLPPFF